MLGTEETVGGDSEVEEDRETLHRLCPTYAQDINSPLRHVRTRIYFTSESHMHSLINVLRFAHLCEHRAPNPSLRSCSLATSMVEERSVTVKFLRHLLDGKCCP